MTGYSVTLFAWNDGLGFQLPEGLISELGLVEGDDLGFEVLGPNMIAVYKANQIAGIDEANRPSSDPSTAT